MSESTSQVRSKTQNFEGFRVKLVLRIRLQELSMLRCLIG